VTDLAARERFILGPPPRIAPLRADQCSQRDLDMLAALRKSIGISQDAPLPELVATMARHPELFQVHSALSVKLYSGTLTSRDSELAILRTAWLCEAPYLWGQHVAHGKRIAAMTVADMERLTIGSSAQDWIAHERAVVRAAEELHAGAMISDQTWAELAQTLNEQQLIELPILCGQYHGIAFLQNSLRLRLMSGKEGLSSR
jgi:alkylhydroperoxidase family enzyme